jgi:hypothetical protein
MGRVKRYYLAWGDGDYAEVGKAEFVKAERLAGFSNTLGMPEEPATGGFGCPARGVRGRVTYDSPEDMREELAPTCSPRTAGSPGRRPW